MYVYVDDKMFNETLLEKGLARVAVFPPDVKNVERFREIQKTAQLAATGIWSIENYATDNGFDDKAVAAAEAKKAAPVTEPTPAPKTTEQAPTPAPKKEPTPAPKATESVSYANCSAVRAAGKAPLRKGEPGYSSKLDRDGDGIAYE